MTQTSLFEREVEETSSLRPLRTRQAAALQRLREAIAEGHKRIVFQAPTGFGKTLTAAHMISGALAKGRKPMFCAPAISLVDQALESFEREGIDDIGVMQAKHPRTNSRATVQVASVQTLLRRRVPEFDFMLIDEVHTGFNGLNEKLDSEEWKNKLVIGLSATPWSRGMGNRWQKLVIAATINDLIADGHAVPARLFCPEHEADRRSFTVKGGEFTDESAGRAMREPTIIGDAIKEWKEHGPQEKTFGFCVDRQSARAQMEAFQDCGIPFGYIDALVDREERKRIFKQMAYGEIAGIMSVGCLIQGVDEDVRVILDLQPRRSEIAHVQKWGRGVRTAPGKAELIGLDLAGNNLDLGIFTDIYHDTLDTREPGERGDAYKEDYKPAKPRKCPRCRSLVATNLRVCPTCGESMPRSRSNVRVVDGRLVELNSGPRGDHKERQAWYSGLLWAASRRGWKEGWAKIAYKEKFGVWPDGLQTRKRKPNEAMMPEVRKYVSERRAEYIRKVQESRTA